MVNPIQATSNALSNATSKASSTPNVNETAFADKLSDSMNASELNDDKSKKDDPCCGGGKGKDEAADVKTIG